MKGESQAVAVSMILLLSLLAGCLSEGTEGAQGPQGPPGEDGSTLHLSVSESDLPDCNAELQGQIYFIPSNGAFQVCSAMGWAVVDLTGLDGVNGTDGIDGLPGIPGEPGPSGEDGNDGLDGLTAIAITSDEAPGINCENGGVRIEVGLDVNRNGSLDIIEVDEESYICNGADGLDGANGVNGSNGTNGSLSPNTMLTNISPTSTSYNCTAGGRTILQGLDNGDGAGIAQNSILEIDEIDYSTIFCSSYVVELMFDLSPYDRSGSLIISYLNGSKIYLSAQLGTYPNLYGKFFIHDNVNSSTWEIDRDSSFIPNRGVFFDSTSYFVKDGDLHAHDFLNDTSWLVSNLSNNQYSFSVSRLIKAGDRIYFKANDRITGNELWVHDTTNSSTWQVVDISTNDYCQWDNGSAISYATLVGNRIYFGACEETSGHALWTHDLSNESTWMVADINPSNSSNLYNIIPGTTPQNFLNSGTMLFFSGNTGLVGSNYDRELWVHDSSNGSTWRVSDIHPGDGCWCGVQYNSHLTLLGERIYFWANDNSSGWELWVYDISNSSIWMTEEINTGPNDLGGVGHIEPMGSRLYMSVINQTIDALGNYHSESELWVHETLNSSTWPIIIEDNYSSLRTLTTVGNSIYFISGSSGPGGDDSQLWRLTIEHSIYYN